MSQSQNGFTALASADTRLVTWNVPTQHGTTRLRLRQGSAGFLLCHLALRFDARVEMLHGPLLDDWAYAYRPVRGYSSTLSNHSSGTAVDFNATQHPLGKEGTFSAAEERAIARTLAIYDGCIRWGGDYRGRKDEMHFELDRSLAVCEAVARELMDSTRGRLLLQVNPHQRSVILS